VADTTTPTTGVPTVRETVRIYGHLIGARIRSDWQYRTSFLLYTLGQTAVSALDLAAIVVIFSQIPSMAGWSLGQVAFLYATTGMSFAIGDVFISQVELASQHIKKGTFDQFLVRPLGPLLQLSASEFALRRVGRFIQPTAVLAVAVVVVHIRWTAARVAVLIEMVTSGAVIFSAIWVVTSSLAFWTVDTQEIANSFTYGGNYATQYPLDILSTWLRRAMLVVPLAFVNYLPATWILGRPDTFHLPEALRLAGPVVALASALVANAVWKTAIRHYRSTGS
jgi:ABC-2 type transport system permease protein